MNRQVPGVKPTYWAAGLRDSYPSDVSKIVYLRNSPELVLGTWKID